MLETEATCTYLILVASFLRVASGHQLLKELLQTTMKQTRKVSTIHQSRGFSARDFLKGPNMAQNEVSIQNRIMSLNIRSK